MRGITLKRTRATLLVGLLGIAVVFALVAVFGGESDAGTASSDIGQALFTTFAAGVIASTAFSFQRGEGPRGQWVPIAIGVGLYALGDISWAILEVGFGLYPYPSIADLFYVLGYGFVALGVFRAGLAYKGLVPLRTAMILMTVVAAAGVAAIYLVLLGPLILPDTELGLLGKALSAFYPLGDVILGLAPAVFVILVVSRLGGGRLAWPWWAVALGQILMAFADSGFSYMDWNGTYAAGSIVDYGWMTAYLLFAIGAAVAGDLAAAAAAPAAAKTRGDEAQAASA